MPFSVQQQLVELDGFLVALRVNGVPVGPADIDRLRRLFVLEPRLDRNGLKTLLSALLVKTPAQRETFEALFADWCPDHEADWSNTDVVEREVQTEQPDTRRPSQVPPSFDTIIAPQQQPSRHFAMALGCASRGAGGRAAGLVVAAPIPPTLHDRRPAPFQCRRRRTRVIPTLYLPRRSRPCGCGRLRSIPRPSTRRGASARWNASSSAWRRWAYGGSRLVAVSPAAPRTSTRVAVLCGLRLATPAIPGTGRRGAYRGA